MSTADPVLDVLVIGGGPAGSTAAAALAMRGRRVRLLERSTFPRHHIGESLLPYADHVYREIGFDPVAAGVEPVEKWGATFIRGNGDDQFHADFREAVEISQPRAFHVDRARFDEALLTHAARLGADVRQGVGVTGVRFEKDRVVVEHADAGGSKGESVARAVVDASGRAGLVARRHGRRVVDDVLQNISVYARYEGVPRLEGQRAGDIRLFPRPDKAWIWLIPLTPSLTSVGVVAPRQLHASLATSDPAEALQHYLDTTPALGNLFASATRSGDVHFESDYSYESERYAGDRWLSAGDAGAFLDPIFSTGVLLAMEAGVDAAAALERALARGDLSARSFRAYESAVRKRYRFFRQFVIGFYDPSFRGLLHEDSSRFGIYEAVLSMLAGNWRPTLATRFRLKLFRLVVAIRRRQAAAMSAKDMTGLEMPGLNRHESKSP